MELGDIFQDLFCTDARFSRAIKFKIIFIFFKSISVREKLLLVCKDESVQNFPYFLNRN